MQQCGILFFTNQIIADYDSNPNKIIYKNLDGHSLSKGMTMNFEWNAGNRLKALMGFTLQDVARVDRIDGKKKKQKPVLTESWSGTWALSYHFPASAFSIDYTGNLYGPMRLPLISQLDPRPGRSPVWSIQNIQLTKKWKSQVEVYAGIKNLLNWTPAKNTPFIIVRAHDPFDKKVEWDANGNLIPTAENPYALTFDPSYVYAPNQGLRFFAGVRCTLKK